MIERYDTSSEEETLAIAKAFAASLGAGDIVSFSGDLGVGKTVFARGIIRALGGADTVTSPTFTLINEYRSGRLPVYHMDFYRLRSPQEALDIGVEDCFYGSGVSLVEWAEHMGSAFPETAIAVTIIHRGGSNRSITIERKDPS